MNEDLSKYKKYLSDTLFAKINNIKKNNKKK